MGVIGAGAWGKNHVRTAATLPEAELVAVCDADPKTRERIGRQYPAVHVTADVADLLSRVDAVVIASPATTHARVALQCVEAGKPCLVEKPFALSTRDAEAVARAAAERKVPVLAGHLLVFQDRKSTRLNSSHSQISYAVFCLKKKKRHKQHQTRRLYPLLLS